MTQDQIERCDALWRRLYARGAVRWMGGMPRADQPHNRVRDLRQDGSVEWTDGGHAPCSYGLGVWEYEATDGDAAVPDFADPATIGCLVALMREATGDAEASCVVYGGLWHCDWHGNESIAETEPEALLLAIQAATASQTPRPACNSFAR